MTKFDGVDTYTQLKMRLDVLGCLDYPPERLFDMAKSGTEDEDSEFVRWFSKMKWERFCNVLQKRIDMGMNLSSMNSVNCGL